MAGIGDVTIVRNTGGLGRVAGNLDGVCGLVVTGVAAAGLALNTPVRIGSLNQAKALGLDSDYDLANGVRIYYHLSEFFRLDNTGVLWLMLVANSNSMSDICLNANELAKKLLREAEGEIRCLGVSVHTETSAGAGLDADVLAAIPNAQILVNEEFAEHRPVDVFLEGIGYGGNATAATDLRSLNARDVSVVIAQDGSRDDTENFWASIGAALGAYSRRRGVNESIGWVQRQNLTGSGSFLSVNLSDGADLKTVSKADLDALADKGYLFAVKYSGYNGAYFWGAPTCIAVSDDFAVVQNNSVIKKAIRVCRKTMLPHIQRSLKVDSATGRLRGDMKAGFESELRQAILREMRGEFSEIGTLIVDPPFDSYNTPYPAINQDNTLRFVIGIVPDGTAAQIVGEIGLQALSVG